LDAVPAHVVAHSSGGAIALRLALRRPELFRSLVMHEPPLFTVLAGDPVAAPLLVRLQETLASVGDMLPRGEDEAAAIRFSAAAFGPGAWEEELAQADRARMIRNAQTFLNELRQPERLTVDVSALRTLSLPVLLTEGSNSSPVRGMVAERLAQALPTSERQQLAGARHMPQLTHPDMFASVVRDFVTMGPTVQAELSQH
jgi:pimeloyl-ACP methyl ester carboxylesterase